MPAAISGASPEVSVVIPTHRRPRLVVAAVRSALAQDYTGNLEVIVVIDGNDPATRSALGAISDPRLRIVNLAVSVGGAEARNAGVRVAGGRLIAFLDDDDEWLPAKLARQIEAIGRSRALYSVVSSRLVVRTPWGDRVRPLRPFRALRPLSEYLFCRGSFADGAYALQTSTLLAPCALLLAVPFRAGLRRHQDWDWALRAASTPGVEFLVVDEPLTLYHAEDARVSTSRSTDWRFSLDWGRTVRVDLTPRAYGWFLASECASRAAKSCAGLPTRLEIAWEYLLHARPTARSFAMLAFFLLTPGPLRRSIHARIRSRRARETNRAAMPSQTGFTHAEA